MCLLTSQKGYPGPQGIFSQQDVTIFSSKFRTGDVLTTGWWVPLASLEMTRPRFNISNIMTIKNVGATVHDTGQQESIQRFSLRVFILVVCEGSGGGEGGLKDASYWSLMENNPMPVSAYIWDEAARFLISSLSNLDHLEGTWATRPRL